MKAEFTLIGVGFYSNEELTQDYTIKDYKIHFDALTKVGFICSIKNSNTPDKIIYTFNVPDMNSNWDKFKQFCESYLVEFWRDGKYFDGMYQEIHDGYAYCFKNYYELKN